MTGWRGTLLQYEREVDGEISPLLDHLGIPEVGAEVEVYYRFAGPGRLSLTSFLWPDGDAVIFYRAFLTPLRPGLVEVVPVALSDGEPHGSARPQVVEEQRDFGRYRQPTVVYRLRGPRFHRVGERGGCLAVRIDYPDERQPSILAAPPYSRQTEHVRVGRKGALVSIFSSSGLIYQRDLLPGESGDIEIRLRAKGRSVRPAIMMSISDG